MKAILQKFKWLPTLAVAAMTIAIVAAASAGCYVPPDRAADAVAYSENVDGYLAVAPTELQAGRAENVSVSLFHGHQPAQGRVSLQLRGANSPERPAASAFVRGSDSITLEVPADLPAGKYQLQMRGYNGDDELAFSDTAKVRVTEPAELLFLETDKPIYKPGQQIRIRALRLDSDLKPLPGPMEVSILDAKGIKVFKDTVTADQFGMAEAGLPLSTEPNLGVWKITAESEEQETQLDVRVEEYVLPKYEVSVDLPREWALVGDAIAGSVSAEYSFGKPVQGELEIVASRYVGVWEEYARFTGDIDGDAPFELPPVAYVAGVSAAGGHGNVQLDVTVREPATGYEERVNHLLTIADAPVSLQLAPESEVFKPGLPYNLLVVAETPGNEPVATGVNATVEYYDAEWNLISDEIHAVTTGASGSALLPLAPPADAERIYLTAETPDLPRSRWEIEIDAAYSPTDSFIHVRPAGDATLSVGDTATFRVHSTNPFRIHSPTLTSRFYYEVISRGRVVFSDFAPSPDIAFEVTPAMTPEAKLVVYQILPNSEVAADYIPFTVSGGYPMDVEINVASGSGQVRPGEAVRIGVQTQGPAKVGLAAVDRSVFILAENRLNLQQVFAELERLYAQPQAEVHWRDQEYRIAARAAAETFSDAGVVVLTDKTVPDAVEALQTRLANLIWGSEESADCSDCVALQAAAIPESADSIEVPQGIPGAAGALGTEFDQHSAEPDAVLAEVQRVRQFFPETWLWADIMTDADGAAVLPAEAPDSITTWNLRAVGVSPDYGLGIANTELTVFQPFFVQVDLPYSAIRGEEFPVKVALYNYLDTPQDFYVEIDPSADFDLLDDPAQSVTVDGNAIGGVEFDIRLTELGRLPIKITARSGDAADAIIKDLLVEPEGVAREIVANAIMSAGDALPYELAAPPGAIPGSNRAYAALTGSYLAQTLNGLENLLQMPYGCGEQNMLLFAPNIYVARYLDATGQLKPEIMAKAEHLMTTGYQRQLTYQRSDGSFSAFGDSDPQGSLWLTAFVLKSFAQADGLIYIDEDVLRSAADWILAHQRGNGSFEPVGFVHHQDLLGGLRGNTALTAYVAIALRDAGYHDQAAMSISYLESRLDDIAAPYTMAIVAYALELAGSPRAADATAALLDMATTDDDGLHWNGPASVETTGYALLALLENGDLINAASAARWLVTQRNAFGGYGSTQDTVVGLQALIQYATHARFDVDMTVTLAAGDWSRQVVINADNADVVQIVELPAGADVRITAAGSGQVVTQVVQRFNMPEVTRPTVETFQIEVEYSADHVAVDDLLEITARFAYTPPESLGPAPDAGMVVLDVAVTTGFAPVTDTVAALVEDNARVKRYEIAGRKVILYLEDLSPGDALEISFNARAQYPVRAQPVTAQAYSYYNPHWRGETLGDSVTVSAN